MTPRTIDLTDLADEVRLSDLQFSPDGKSVIVVASRRNYEANRFENELVLIDVESGSNRALGLGLSDVSHPRWSPDGRLLALLANDEDEHLQVFVATSAGRSPHQLTDAPSGVRSFAWRPGAETIAFVAEDVPVARPDEERHNRSFEVGDHSYLAENPAMPSHIWLIPIDGNDAKRMTSGREGFCTFLGMLSWSADGHLLSYTSQPNPDSGAMIESSIRILNVENGQVLDFGPSGSVSAAFSPFGDQIAFCRPRAELGFSPAGIYLGSLLSDSFRELTEEIDRDFLAFGQGKAGMQWAADGESLVLSANDLTTRSVWILPREGAPRRLSLNDVVPIEIATDRSGRFVMIGSTADRPVEIYSMDSPDAEPRRITDFNAHFGRLELGNRTSFSWEGPDDFAGTGVITYPPGFESQGSYPLVLDIHGGPMAAATEAFSVLHHVMAARGWIVLSPNYRGSNNMGQVYQRAVINDAGDGPTRDIMSGVRALEARGFIDRNRLAVSGWSYGGFLTAWLTAHEHIWRAAVAGAAVSSWVDWYNLADLNVWCGLGLNGTPWRENGLEHYQKHSVITYARHIRTPTLLMSMTGDRRVSVTQSYKLYHALKDNGTDVKFIAYPISGHFPADPIHERDVYRRWISWIEGRFE